MKTLPLRRVILLYLILSLSLGCALMQAKPGAPLLPVPASTVTAPVETPRQPSPPPTSLPADAQLLVDYTYTSELITVIYPLYGNILDDFTVVVITNTGQTPAQVVIQSEITGYTDPQIDTQRIEPGAVVEIRQNPRLIPEKLDDLNVDKPAQFHLIVTAQTPTGERTLLNQVGRELLLLQSSDWPFLVTTGQAKEYAIQRFVQHVDRFNALLDSLDRGAPDLDLTAELWEKDKVFPEIDFRWFAR